MKVLLAVDGSDQSLDAVRAMGCLNPAETLTVLYVVHLPHLSYPTLGPNLNKDLALTVEQAMKEEGERLLNQAVSLLPPHHGRTVHKMVEGIPSEVILQEAETCGANIIVLGDRGLGEIKEQFLGSVSHRVMVHASCPVFIVKGPTRHVRQMLVPIAGPEDSKAVGEFFSKKPFRDSPDITVLHVVPFAEPAGPVGALIPDSFRKEMIAHGEEMANEVVKTIGKYGYEGKSLAVVGAPSVAIVQEAANSQADVILMRSHNRTGASRFFLGSVSHGVMHHAKCSVILIR